MNRIVLVVVLSSTLVPTAAAAQPKRGSPAPSRADELLRVGLERYEAGDFVGAIAAFEEGYAIEPRPTFLFAAAQAKRRSGDCAGAIADYDRFLATLPSESQAAAAREQRAVCIATLPPEPEARTAAPPPPPRRWYHDRVTLTLTVSSGALLLSSAALGVVGADTLDAANTALDYDEYGSLVDEGRMYQTLAWVTLAGGVALGGWATWRIVRHDSGERPSSARALRVGPGPGTAGLSLHGAF